MAEQFQRLGKGKNARIIGHGIGLELNEPPIPSQYDASVVKEGCVIALDLHMMDDCAGGVVKTGKGPLFLDMLFALAYTRAQKTPLCKYARLR